MLLRILAFIGIVPLSAGLLGCKCPSAGCVPRTSCTPCVNELVVPDQNLPEFVELASAETLVPLPAPLETYELIDAGTCQCRAATNLATANMIELERYWARIVIECDTKNVGENLHLDRDLLALHATGLRNAAASTALQAFYQLAGVELQKKYLHLAMEESRLTLNRIDKLQAKGIDLPDQIDRSVVASQLAELEDKRLQLEFLRIQLNGQLQKMMGCPLNEYTFYWPEFDWQPDMMPVDVEGALSLGLETRSDLRGLALVICQLERITLPVARAVLRFADSTLGNVEPQDGVIHWMRCHNCNANEVPVRCRQLALFYSDTEQSATAEIKGYAYEIGLQQQRVVAARELVVELEGRLNELAGTRDIADTSVFEISNARGRVYNAQSKLIEQIVALHIAQVKLREAQGMLAVECGICPTLCCEGCCNGACVRCNSRGTKQRCCTKSRCREKQSCCE